jgi:hypothetical protein
MTFHRNIHETGVMVFTLGLALVLAGASLLASPAMAQRRGGFVFAASAHSGPGAAHVGAPVARREAAARIAGRRGRRGTTGYGYLSDYYPYYDTPFDQGDETAESLPPREPPQVASAGVTKPAPSSTKAAESLVVELRGDHWVRLTGYGASEIGGQLPSSQIVPEPHGAASVGKSASKNTDSAASGSTATDPKLPPAVLVFRDGHREEISRYTIINKNIAIKSDYYTSGSWTRNIAIADLNIPATLKANQERNTKFTLPSRPNEVVMRP